MDAIREETEQARHQLGLLRRRLEATEQKQERLRDVYIYRAAIDQETFEAESLKLSDERRDIERAIGTLSGPRIENPEATVLSGLEILSDLLGSWNSAKGQARWRFQHGRFRPESIRR